MFGIRKLKEKIKSLEKDMDYLSFKVNNPFKYKIGDNIYFMINGSLKLGEIYHCYIHRSPKLGNYYQIMIDNYRYDFIESDLFSKEQFKNICDSECKGTKKKK